jgi:hypothetical protein
MHAPHARQTPVVAVAVVFAAAMVAAGPGTAAADGPPAVIRACVSGGTLTEVSAAPDDVSGRVFAPRYRLAGKKALVKEIKKEHAGHGDEFTGTISGDLEGIGAGRTVDLGGVAVTMGGAGPNSQPNAPRVPETPVFKVTSFRHTDVKCRP